MRCRAIIGLALASILGGLGALHVFWAMSRHPSSEAFIPTDAAGRLAFRPGRAATAVVGLLLIGAALVAEAASSSAAGPALAWGARAIAFAFVARAIGDLRWVGAFKRVRGTTFARWDDRLYTPLCLLIGILALALEPGLLASLVG